MSVPLAARPLAGITWAIDVHVLDKGDGPALLKMEHEGWVNLRRTDTMLAEVLRAQDPVKRARLRAQVLDGSVLRGPTVLGHSLVDWSVLATESDQIALREVFELMWPTHDYEADGRQTTRAGSARFRDSMHVHTTIRYGISAFVTDDPGILEAGDRLHARFAAFRVLPVSTALIIAEQEIANVRRREREHPRLDFPLPSQPPVGAA